MASWMSKLYRSRAKKRVEQEAPEMLGVQLESLHLIWTVQPSRLSHKQNETLRNNLSWLENTLENIPLFGSVQNANCTIHNKNFIYSSLCTVTVCLVFCFFFPLLDLRHVASLCCLVDLGSLVLDGAKLAFHYSTSLTLRRIGTCILPSSRRVSSSKALPVNRFLPLLHWKINRSTDLKKN